MSALLLNRLGACMRHTKVGLTRAACEWLSPQGTMIATLMSAIVTAMAAGGVGGSKARVGVAR